MRLTPNLSFRGQCEAAFKFYQNRFYAHLWQIAHGRTSATEMA